MTLHLTPAAAAAYLRLVNTEELGLLPRQLTPEALPHALARCNAAATFRLEHPHLVGTPDDWGPGAARTVQRWDAEDQQLLARGHETGVSRGHQFFLQCGGEESHESQLSHP